MGYIPPQLIKKSGNLIQPALSSLSFDGTRVEGIDLNSIYEMIGQNGLNILDITAQSSLTAGVNANFVRDIYSVAAGYLNSVNTGNTTALFSTNKYSNISLNNYSNDTEVTHGTGTSTIKKTFDLTSSPSLISEVTDQAKAAANAGGARVKVIYTYNDDTTGEVEQVGLTTSYVIYTFTNPNPTKLVKQVDIALQHINWDLVYERNTDFNAKTSENKLIVEMNEQSLEFTPTKFMIISNEEKIGTGFADYDISFDGGSNEQTGLSSFTEYDIVNQGNGMILTQNLNAGASSGIVECSDYGVMIW